MRSLNFRCYEYLHVILVAGLILCGMSGCARYWYQEGKTFEQCKRDREVCRQELLKHSDLTKVGTYEIKFIEECMQQRGYRLVKESELLMHVRREAPETSFHYRAKGVAGRLEERGSKSD